LGAIATLFARNVDSVEAEMAAGALIDAAEPFGSV
jgi:hypothetical protein